MAPPCPGWDGVWGRDRTGAPGGGAAPGFGGPSPQARPGLQHLSLAIAWEEGCKWAESDGSFRRKCVLPVRAGTPWSELFWELQSSSGDQLRSGRPSPA